MGTRSRAYHLEHVGNSLSRQNCRNIAEQLIEKGLATALRHRRDDESRSSEYDKLMAAEQTYGTSAHFAA